MTRMRGDQKNGRKGGSIICYRWNGRKLTSGGLWNYEFEIIASRAVIQRSNELANTSKVISHIQVNNASRLQVIDVILQHLELLLCVLQDRQNCGKRIFRSLDPSRRLVDLRLISHLLTVVLVVRNTIASRLFMFCHFFTRLDQSNEVQICFTEGLLKGFPLYLAIQLVELLLCDVVRSCAGVESLEMLTSFLRNETWGLLDIQIRRHFALVVRLRTVLANFEERVAPSITTVAPSGMSGPITPRFRVSMFRVLPMGVVLVPVLVLEVRMLLSDRTDVHITLPVVGLVFAVEEGAHVPGMRLGLLRVVDVVVEAPMRDLGPQLRVGNVV